MPEDFINLLADLKEAEVIKLTGERLEAGGASVDKCNPDNLRAMVAAAREYGTY